MHNPPKKHFNTFYPNKLTDFIFFLQKIDDHLLLQIQIIYIFTYK